MVQDNLSVMHSTTFNYAYDDLLPPINYTAKRRIDRITTISDCEFGLVIGLPLPM